MAILAPQFAEALKRVEPKADDKKNAAKAHTEVREALERDAELIGRHPRKFGNILGNRPIARRQILRMHFPKQAQYWRLEGNKYFAAALICETLVACRPGAAAQA